MITDLINGLKKHEIFRSQITSYFPDSFEKLRMRAIAQKALREGYSRNIIVQTLLKDPDFEKITNQLSQEECLKMVLEIVAIAHNQESSFISSH